jgi:hypothetical protein
LMSASCNTVSAPFSALGSNRPITGRAARAHHLTN